MQSYLLQPKQIRDCLMMWGGKERLEGRITKGQEETFGLDMFIISSGVMVCGYIHFISCKLSHSKYICV